MDIDAIRDAVIAAGYEQAGDRVLLSFNSAPARATRSIGNNVPGRYQSWKMRVTIQTESRTVELPAVIMYEFGEPDVVAYIEQPDPALPVLVGERGRTYLQVPDFLVVRRTWVGYEEWKSEERLLALARRHPDRWIHDSRTGWHRPHAEQAAAALGLGYRVRSSAEIERTYVRNLDVLADYFNDPAPRISDEARAAILTAVRARPGITTLQLLALGRAS